MPAKQTYSVSLVRDISKKNKPYWVSGPLNLKTIMDEVGSTKVSMEISNKITDSEQTIQLRFKQAWGDKMDNLTIKQMGKYQSVSFPMWFKEGTKKNGEKFQVNNGTNYNMLDLEGLLSREVQIRIFLNENRKSEKSPSLSVSFSKFFKKQQQQQRTATASVSEEELRF